MNGAAEAATQSGDFSGAMWALVAVGLIGFIILIFPDIMTKGGWKWQAGDLNGSIQLGEKALQIKIRILGDEHVKVLELKNQLQQARTQALQTQIKPQQNP